MRAARLADKTAWRGRRFKLADSEPDVPPEVSSTEDASEDAVIPTANDDAVLEEEPDEADVSGLVDHHEADDPKER
jgi:hypothetical protein